MIPYYYLVDSNISAARRILLDDYKRISYYADIFISIDIIEAMDGELIIVNDPPLPF